MQIWIRTQNNADHEPDPQHCEEVTVVLPVRLYEGVGHEPARHGPESLPLDGKEYPVDGHMIPGNAGAGGVAPAVDGHAARDVASGNRVAVFLPPKIFLALRTETGLLRTTTNGGESDLVGLRYEIV
jgi:hypothetical protein